MGLLSVLGKIGGIAAAPFTGGMSLIPTVLSAAGDIGSVLGKQQQGKAQGQVAQESANLSRDRNAIDLYQAQQGAQHTAAQDDLQRKSFESSNRATTGKQALIAALLSGKMDPTTISGGKASGGLLAALQNNPEALAAMKSLHGSASAAQSAPLSFSGGNILTAPTLTQPTQVDNGGFLATLANIGQIAGAANPYKKPIPEETAGPR